METFNTAWPILSIVLNTNLFVSLFLCGNKYAFTYLFYLFTKHFSDLNQYGTFENAEFYADFKFVEMGTKN